MEKLTSILVILNATGFSEALRKAEILAQRHGARLEILHLDARLQGGVQRSLIARLREGQADLIIKQASTRFRDDLPLLRAGSTPVLLVRNKAWSACLAIAVAVDLSKRERAESARAVLHTAGYIAESCHARIDVVFSRPRSSPEVLQAVWGEQLRRLVHEFRIGGERLQVLYGAALDTLPAFLKDKGYELVVLGPFRRHGLTEVWGNLSSRLAETLDCDFLFTGQNRALRASDPSGRKSAKTKQTVVKMPTRTCRESNA